MAASHVVTIKFVIMESPCENRGLCIGELLLNLSVMEHFEKINDLQKQSFSLGPSWLLP
jgi:hypothetical protein